MSHRDGQRLLPAAVWRSRANATCIWTCFLHLPSNSFFPSCSISSQDKSATCSSNLAPSTGPLWYQFPYGFTRSRNPGSPRFISPTCFECHISRARGHTRTCPCAHKRAHSCALPFHCRHNSQFWLCASLIPPSLCLRGMLIRGRWLPARLCASVPRLLRRLPSPSSCFYLHPSLQSVFALVRPLPLSVDAFIAHVSHLLLVFSLSYRIAANHVFFNPPPPPPPSKPAPLHPPLLV